MARGAPAAGGAADRLRRREKPAGRTIIQRTRAKEEQMGKRNGRRNGAGTGDLVTDAVKGAMAGAARCSGSGSS